MWADRIRSITAASVSVTCVIGAGASSQDVGKAGHIAAPLRVESGQCRLGFRETVELIVGVAAEPEPFPHRHQISLTREARNCVLR